MTWVKTAAGFEGADHILASHSLNPVSYTHLTLPTKA